MYKLLKNKKGFTLVEIITVLVIIVIIAAIAVPSYKAITESTNANACLTNKKLLGEAWKLYKSKHTVSDENIENISSFLLSQRYISDELTCEHGEVYKLIDGEIVCKIHDQIASTSNIPTQSPSPTATPSPASTPTNSTTTTTATPSGTTTTSSSNTIKPTTTPTSSPTQTSTAQPTTSPTTPATPIPTATPHPSLNGDVIFKVNNVFSNNTFQYSFTVKNTSSDYIYGWAVDFYYPGVLSADAYNFDLEVLGANRYRMVCRDYNFAIAPGGTVTSNGDGSVYNDDYIYDVDVRKPYDAVNCKIELNITSQWNQNTASAGFNYQIKLTNNSSKPIIGWVLEFDYNGEITKSDENRLTKIGEHKYRIISNGGDITIAGNGGSISFTGQGTQVGNLISNVTLDGYPITQINYTYQ